MNIQLTIDRPASIRALIAARDIRRQEIAAAAGVSASHVSNVLSGRGRSEAVERAIADLLGISPAVVDSALSHKDA